VIIIGCDDVNLNYTSRLAFFVALTRARSSLLQTVQGYSPLGAGLRILPWTGMPMLLAPVVGILAQRWGGKPLVLVGLVLQAIGLFWLALILTPTTAYTQMVPAFIVAGLGMTMFFVPIASLVLGSVNKTSKVSPPARMRPFESWAASLVSRFWARSSRRAVDTSRHRTT